MSLILHSSELSTPSLGVKMNFLLRVTVGHIVLFCIVAVALFAQPLFHFAGQFFFKVTCIVFLAVIQTSLVLFLLLGDHSTFCCWKATDRTDIDQPGAAPAAAPDWTDIDQPGAAPAA